MKLSIITVNYNNLEGLRKTLESVCAQTFHDYEWIVIDGGSTDGSKQLLEQNDEHIAYWVSEPDSGIYNAMNKGIAIAKGEYCQFLNSGDYYIGNDTLAKVFEIPQLADVNYGDQWCADHGKVVERRTYPSPMTLDYLFRSPLGHQATFFRTEVVKVHPYREQYTISGDRALYLELYTAGYRREFFSDQVVNDIQRLLSDSNNYQFVCRVAPLRWCYNLCRKIQHFRNHQR